MLDELHQPSVVESVVELSDVGIEHPAHLLRSDPNRQRIQRLMRAAPRSESIREPQKVLFVNRVQHFDSGTLDDLVFKRGNAERAKLAWFTRLRDVHSAHRSCPVRSLPEPLGEIVEVFLKGLSVLLPRLAVYARGSAPLHFQVRCSQPVHVIDVVQERGEHRSHIVNVRRIAQRQVSPPLSMQT
jgi:hypothetical protein